MKKKKKIHTYKNIQQTKTEAEIKRNKEYTICTTGYYNRPVYSNGNIQKPAPC